MTKEASCSRLCFLDLFPIVTCFQKYSTWCRIWSVDLKLFTGWDRWRYCAVYVYWSIGPNRPFASIAIGIRSLLLRSKSPIAASPGGTGGSALVLLLLLSFFLSKSRRKMSALPVNVVIQSSELARFCVEGSGFVALAMVMVILKPIVLYLCE